MRVLLILTLLLLAAPSFASSTGVTITPDQVDILISKDVGAERWAITFSVGATAPTITGNVFRTDGGEPSFLYCLPTRVDGTASDVANAVFHFECFGTSACRPGNCPSWSLISTDIPVPGSFFLPR